MERVGESWREVERGGERWSERASLVVYIRQALEFSVMYTYTTEELT